MTGLKPDLQSSLFSAIVTAFLIRSFDDLEPNYQQQTALLLHQLLNGRDPNLAIISNPTIPKKTPGIAIAVNSLWCASLTISLCTSIQAMSLKWWLTEYNGGANPVGGLFRACQRHTWFTAFERLNIPALVAFLPTLLLNSIRIFFAGGIIYLWQLNKIVMTVFVITGGLFIVAYFLLFAFPSVINLPLFQNPAFIFHLPSNPIKRAAIFVVGGFIRLWYLILRCVTGAVLFPFIQTALGTGTFHHWYMQTQTISSEEHKHTCVGRDITSGGIDTSQRTREEAILWLSQAPLDPFESKALISSLALISPSRPYGRFQKPVAALANLVFEASFREGEDQTNTAVDCILVLGNINFQSTVGQSSDYGHNIGDIPAPPSIVSVAQQLTINAPKTDLDILHSGGVRGRLLTAAAWLSPVKGAEDVEWNGKKLRIQDRSQFIEPIRTMLDRHVYNDEPLENKVLINLIHGMHAFIPRGNCDNAPSVVPLPPYFREDYDSPWPEDEAVLRALITYALDLLLPPDKRKPLVEREISFDDLAPELIDASLMAKTTYSGIVAFAFWLASRVPHAFTSRKMGPVDIAQIWFQTNEAIPGDRRDRLDFHAADAFIAVAQHHVLASGGLPRFTGYTALKLLNAALESGYRRPMTIYTIAMILNLDTSAQATPVTNEIEVESIIDALFSGLSDPEKGTAEEDVDIRIYSTLILLKLLPTVELDAERVKGLIVQTEEVIRDPPARDPGVARSSEAANVDLDRARWKAIYLSALLLRFLPDDEREGHAEQLRTRVRELLKSGGLSFMCDYRRCLKPLDVDVSPTADQRRQTNVIFEEWIGEFPLFQLAGTVSERLLARQTRNRPSLLNPRRWFG